MLKALLAEIRRALEREGPLVLVDFSASTVAVPVAAAAALDRPGWR